ncbi:UNVERIFIED_CONTAM: hypothetical protein FKN15_026358 [Acipenser sinensis]
MGEEPQPSPESEGEKLRPSPVPVLTTTAVQQSGACELDPSTWVPSHVTFVFGPLVTGPNSQVAAPPGTVIRVVFCSAPPGESDVSAQSGSNLLFVPVF